MDKTLHQCNIHAFPWNLIDSVESPVFRTLNHGSSDRIQANYGSSRSSVGVNYSQESNMGLVCESYKIWFHIVNVYSSAFQSFCCSGTFRKCFHCSWNPMHWSKCLYCHHRTELVANLIPGNFGLFRRNPGSHSRNPGWKTVVYGINLIKPNAQGTFRLTAKSQIKAFWLGLTFCTISAASRNMVIFNISTSRTLR